MVYSFACSENEDPLVYRFTEQMKRGLKFSSSIWKVYWQGELHIKYMHLGINFISHCFILIASTLHL
jgi:hypothetical protein